jgi:hypothetical protein
VLRIQICSFSCLETLHLLPQHGCDYPVIPISHTAVSCSGRYANTAAFSAVVGHIDDNKNKIVIIHGYERLIQFTSHCLYDINKIAKANSEVSMKHSRFSFIAAVSGSHCFKLCAIFNK